MNPQGLTFWDVAGMLALAGVVGCAVGVLLGLVGMILEKLSSWSGGLLDRPKRRLK